MFSPSNKNRIISWKNIFRRLIPGLITAGFVLFTIWPWIPGIRQKSTRTIVLYGFSILGEVMNEGIFPEFQRDWEERTGENLEFIFIRYGLIVS